MLQIFLVVQEQYSVQTRPLFVDHASPLEPANATRAPEVLAQNKSNALAGKTASAFDSRMTSYTSAKHPWYTNHFKVESCASV